ncbi:NAD(P)H-binding protein [uncultured Ferrimonas sp.]|uniref:NAD(P)H-binding protein n=1 Tax=uncultured Ferrimonas sp. TaxID=432640 RepID=UPI00260F9184|nr:NAD(P)H-binding protein [uncultured Ferrimonas sp.]
MKSVLVAGATGAVGRQLINQLLASSNVTTVHVLSRRATQWQSHPQVIEHILPLAHISKLQVANGVDAVFCCLGTTIKQAGSKAAFTAVDLDAVLSLGLWAVQQQVAQFHVISSLGVSPKSRGFYLQTKQQMEQRLQQIGLKGLCIYRPSMLLAQRDEFRLGEFIGGLAMRALAWLPGADAWRPVRVEQVATALLAQASNGISGTKVIDSAQIQLAQHPHYQQQAECS